VEGSEDAVVGWFCSGRSEESASTFPCHSTHIPPPGSSPDHLVIGSATQERENPHNQKLPVERRQTYVTKTNDEKISPALGRGSSTIAVLSDHY
jgi:hypothetical protein